LQKLGIVNGCDMTFSACLTKLSYLLGKNLDYKEIRELMTKNIRGELTPQANEDIFSYKEEHFI
jgi:L-asparaginase